MVAARPSAAASNATQFYLGEWGNPPARAPQFNIRIQRSVK
jgi:hypothetical protein